MRSTNLLRMASIMVRMERGSTEQDVSKERHGSNARNAGVDVSMDVDGTLHSSDVDMIELPKLRRCLSL